MLPTDQILSAADQLPDDQLNVLAQQVAQLAAKHRYAALPIREIELLQRINDEPDAERVTRYVELRTRRGIGSLDETETNELLSLSDWLEETHSERLRAVAELAQLRGLSLPEMMSELGVRHLVYGTRVKLSGY